MGFFAVSVFSKSVFERGLELPNYEKLREKRWGTSIVVGVNCRRVLCMHACCSMHACKYVCTPPATLAQGKKECNKKHDKGGKEKMKPMIRCEQRFDNAKSCLLCRGNRPVVLSYAVLFSWFYVLIGSTGVICVGEKTGRHERSHTCKKKKKRKITGN